MEARGRIGAVAVLIAIMVLGCAARDRVGRAQELRDLAQSSLAQIDGALELADVRAPVEVLRDRWGVAHIYAQNPDDLFFAQGLVAAQDRLWQMEWWRRYGAGELAEVLGPVALRHDRFARLLRYRGDMEAEYTSYHPEGRRIMTAFAAGVNAWIDWSVARDRLPVEFQLTGIEPGRWSSEVPLLRMAGLGMTGDNLRELDLARLVSEVGLDEANRRSAPDPFRELTVPQGLDVDAVPAEFRQLVLGAALPAPPLLERFAAVEDLFDPVTGIALASAIPLLAARVGVAGRQPGDGSNNWVVAGALSATDAPLLANDPHRTIALPSLRYLVHLNAPGWNVIGSGEPALPGVAIGHNERIGWGLTIVGIDQGDMFVERLNPDDPTQVWHNDAWEALEVTVEEIPVRGQAPEVVELKYSHHGPVLWEDPDRGLAYAFKTVLSEPGTAGYLGSLRVDQASDWDSYTDALQAWKVPSENMIYADVDGNIGWLAAGLAPVREGWSGRLPVPGDGTYEWRGFRDTLELPHEFNPSRGFITTANHNIMPADYSPPLGYRWSSPVRYDRLRSVLEFAAPFSRADFETLQYDVFSEVASSRVAGLTAMTFADATLERARLLLAVWDAALSTDSAGAALYKSWESACRAAEVDADEIDPENAAATLRTAIATMEAEQGTDWTKWRWGASNRMARPHALVDTFDLPVVERPGDGTTVNVGVRSHGASFREVLDVADWDNSVATSTPGQSGQPGSPFYRNLSRLWEDGEYFPLLYSRDAVTRNVAHRLLLLPRENDQ